MSLLFFKENGLLKNRVNNSKRQWTPQNKSVRLACLLSGFVHVAQIARPLTHCYCSTVVCLLVYFVW